jgi:hypothetical protein
VSPDPPIYVSYLGVPTRHRRLLRVAVPGALWALVVVAAVWAFGQRDPGDAVWDDAHLRTFTGLYVHRPYPMLSADDRGDGTPGVMLLVEVGKHGVTRVPAELDGQRVRAQGWLLVRDGRTMIELDPESTPRPERGPSDGAAIAEVSLRATPTGRVTLRGEIVDFKCFLGAMKPGSGKSHKACAALCVRGGVPPVMVARGADGSVAYFLLQSADAGPAASLVQPFVGDDVELVGDSSTLGDLRLVALEPGAIRRR